MDKKLIDSIRELLSPLQGKTVDYKYIRSELELEPYGTEWNSIRKLLTHDLTKEKFVKPIGKIAGVFKVIKQVEPVVVFNKSRERRPPLTIIFPRDKYGEEMSFGKHIVIREGDLITIGGVKSKGKTALCLGFVGENIDKSPVLMGNEYTVSVDGRHEPAPRFINRLDRMSEWITWINEDGTDRFELLPVREDYAEHIVKNRINIIDWINMDGDRLYDIGKVLEDIKSNLGRGIAIVALQKGENAKDPRGSQFVRDFSDVEIVLDGFGENSDDILLTLRGAKEKTAPIVGKKYAYTIVNSGTQIDDFREVVRCHWCYGKGYQLKGPSKTPCEGCNKTGYVNKKVDSPL